MYDIKIFLEDNWEFWARINAWKEIIYWTWKNQIELMENLKEWLEISFSDKNKNENVAQLFSYFNTDTKKLICH